MIAWQLFSLILGQTHGWGTTDEKTSHQILKTFQSGSAFSEEAILQTSWCLQSLDLEGEHEHEQHDVDHDHDVDVDDVDLEGEHELEQPQGNR